MRRAAPPEEVAFRKLTRNPAAHSTGMLTRIIDDKIAMRDDQNVIFRPGCPAMNSAHDSAPWLRHYGAVPAHLDYPECTLYRMIAAAAARAPDVVAWDFFDQRSTYRQLLADVDTCADALAVLG